MADANYNLGINISVGSVGVSSTLNAIEERFDKFSKSVKASSQSMNASMKGSMSTIDAEMNKFDQLNSKMQQVSTGKDNVSSKSRKVEQTSKKEKKAVDNLGKTTNKHTKALKDNTSQTDNWLSSHSRSIGIAVKSTVVWGLATTAIYGSQRAMRIMHETMMDVNSEMIALRRVMEEATTDFDALRNTAADLGVEFAANIEDVVASMVEWGRQGRSQVEVIELTKAALLATNVAQMDASQSVDLLTSALLQFNMEASESISIIDRWNEVANNYAINATDIAMSIRESGAAARSAGISMDELIGMTTALSAATAKTGNRIGRSLRTVFSRMMGDMGDVGDSVGKVEVALNSVGVSLRRSETEYRNMTDVITDLAVTWDDLDEVMQANIARAIGGRRRYSDVIALIENWDMALDATQTSMGSLNSALEENETYMEGVEAQWTQVGAAFNRIINTLTEGGFDTWSIAVANTLESLLNTVNNLVKGVQTLGKVFGVAGLVGVMAKVVSVMTTVNTTMNTSVVTATAFGNATAYATTGATGLLSAINPLYVAIAGLTALTAKYTTEVGESINSIEEATDAKENFAKISKEVNSMTETEIKNSKELVNQYSQLSSEAQTLLNNTSLFTTDDVFSYSSNLIRGIIPGVEDDADKALNIMEKLSTAFPNIYKEAGLDTEQFFELLEEELKSLNGYLENSVAWIVKETDSMYENTIQGMRNAKMLQDKSDRYFKLANMTNKTIAQEKEMTQIQRELRGEFYELATSEKTFSQALQELTQNQLSKFTKGGTEVNDTIKEMREQVDVLSSKENELETSWKEQGDRISDLRTKYESLVNSEESTAYQINQTEDALKSAQAKYEAIGDALDLTREKQAEYINNIETLQGGLENIDIGQFLSNFEGAISILTDFNDEVDDIIVSLEDMRAELTDELDFENIMGDLLGRTGIEQIEAEMGVLESYSSEAQDMYKEIFMLNPRDFETGQELEDYIEENFGDVLDKVDIDISKIYEAWDEEGFVGAQKAGLNLATNLITEFENRLENKQGKKSIMELYNEGVAIDDIASAPIEDLERLNEIKAKIAESDISISSVYTPEQQAVLDSLVLSAREELKFRQKESKEREDIAENIRIMNEQLRLEEEITSSLNKMRSEGLTGYDKDLQEVNTKLEQLNKWQSQVYDPALINNIKTFRAELQKEKELLEAIVQIEDMGIIEEFQDFDISEITNMEEAEKEIKRLENGLTDFKDTLKTLGVSEDQLTDTLEILGLDQETIDAVFEEIRGKINSLQDAWYTTISDAIVNSVDKFTEEMSSGERFSIMFREGLSSAFDNLPEDEIRSKFEAIGSGLGDMLNFGDGFGEAFGEFATQAGKVFGEGGSAGQSIATGIASVISGSPLIGRAVGALSQAIFGGVEGRDRMEEAREINDQIKEVQSSLQDFGITYDAELATYQDNAGILQAAFGGEDWSTEGLNKAKVDLEEMETVLDRVKETASGLTQGIKSIFSENLSYNDFRQRFDDTVGQAIQDAILNKLFETQVIGQYMDRLAGMMEGVITDSGEINQEALARFRQEVDLVQSEVENVYRLYQQILGEDFGVDIGTSVEPNVTMDRTFRAGSTSAITYNNTFAVQSQIFLGDKASARDAAKQLAPYIREFIESKA